VRSGPGSCVIRSGLFGRRPMCCVVLLCYGFLSHFLLLNGMKRNSPALLRERK
jgi:hypothetical protein